MQDKIEIGDKKEQCVEQSMSILSPLQGPPTEDFK
jgi:hypothetical protein